MNKEIKITGLDCGKCALDLEDRLKKTEGVSSAHVDFVRQRVRLDCDGEKSYQRAIEQINGFEDVRVVEQPSRAGLAAAHKTEIVCVALSFVFLAAGIVLEQFASGLAAEIAQYILFGLSYFIVGWKILWNTVKNLSRGEIFDENFLMTVASIGAIALGQYAEAAEVMALYSLGELLQSVAVGASRRSIASLMQLKSETATLLTEQGEKIVPPEEIKKGDRLLIKAGEKIAADGVIVRGRTSLDTRSLSGEAMLRDVGEGDKVLGGCINVGGVIEVVAEKDYSESTVAKILDLVENSTSKKAKSEQFITKFSRIYTPVVCIAALLVAFLAPVFTGNYVANLGSWVNRALVFLVISCPCALVISVPLSYFSGIGFAAKHGVLVKGSTGLDALAAARIAAFDKTGTLTYGNFVIGNVYGEDKDLLLAVAAAAEKNSSHPLAEAFRDLPVKYEATDVQERAGYGIECTIGGERVLAGNKKLMDVYGISVQNVEDAGTLVYVAKGGKYLGCVVIEDKIKENARDALAQLKKEGISACYMLTGDSRRRAEAVAKQVGVDGVYAELLPADKLTTAQHLQEQGKLMYVGDGINDAPVLVQADAGVSMGGVGSDAAIEASEVVLMRDDLSLLPFAKKTARRTRVIVFENIVFSIAVKVIIMALGLFNLIPLGLAVFADVGVMLLAVFNSFRTRIEFSRPAAPEKCKI